MNININRINKAITSALTGTLAWGAVVVASPPEGVTASEWLALAGVYVTAFLVYAVPNADPPVVDVPVPVDPPVVMPPLVQPTVAPVQPTTATPITPAPYATTTVSTGVMQPDPTVTVQGP